MPKVDEGCRRDVSTRHLVRRSDWLPSCYVIQMPRPHFVPPTLPQPAAAAVINRHNGFSFRRPASAASNKATTTTTTTTAAAAAAD
jgi:hypothetical protein